MAKATKPPPIVLELRRAIETNDKTIYAIAKGSGVSYGMITRFLSGERDLRLATAGKIAAHLGLHLAQKQ